jgi:hypothetical protein
MRKMNEYQLNKLAIRISESINKDKKEVKEYLNPAPLETGDAILTIILGAIGLLSVAGSHVILPFVKNMIKKLREMGADEEAEEAETKLRMEMKKSKGMDNDSEIEETNSKLKEAYLRRRRTNRR